MIRMRLHALVLGSISHLTYPETQIRHLFLKLVRKVVLRTSLLIGEGGWSLAKDNDFQPRLITPFLAFPTYFMMC
ncbi:hypothetical protein BDQ17DRAFT_1369735 [Cyathus striatus]|nr:hypothetical protein BDQ17DRAFT_1369735 [Cyathus striatus]